MWRDYRLMRYLTSSYVACHSTLLTCSGKSFITIEAIDSFHSIYILFRRYRFMWRLIEFPGWSFGWWYFTFWDLRYTALNLGCYCHSLNVNPQNSCWILTPPQKMMVIRGRASGRYLSHEGRTLMHGIGAFIKQTPEKSLSLPPGEDTTTILWPQREPSFDHAGTLVSAFQPPKLWERGCCWLWATQLVVFSYSTLKEHRELSSWPIWIDGSWKMQLPLCSEIFMRYHEDFSILKINDLAISRIWA